MLPEVSLFSVFQSTKPVGDWLPLPNLPLWPMFQFVMKEKDKPIAIHLSQSYSQPSTNNYLCLYIFTHLLLFLVQ